MQKYKPKRTLKQNSLFWSHLEFFARKIGVFNKTEIKYIYEGIKQKYAYRRNSIIRDADGEPEKVPIGLSECNRLEQFQAYFDGLYLEAGEQRVDMGECIQEWERLKREKIDKSKQKS